MASATTALANLAPYQPPEGLGPREILAHAREHIDKLTKRHLNLQGKIGDTTEYLGKKLVNPAGSGIALGTSALFGFVNGRYGGDKGYVAPYGAPVDLPNRPAILGDYGVSGRPSWSERYVACARGP
jgi:hypothetical protein